MTVIDGVNVAKYDCEKCGGDTFWIFSGMGGKGYKIACAKCHEDQRDLIRELKLPYLWKRFEVESDIEL